MRYVVATSLHTSSVDQVGAAAGDDVTTAHFHSNTNHAMRGHATTGRGDHCGDVSSTSLRVKVCSPTVLPVQLTLGIIGISCSAMER